MKKLFAIFVFLTISSIPTVAQFKSSSQVGPLFEVNGGYTFQRWETPPIFQPGPSSLNFNGFNAGAAYHITRWLAGVVDVTGTYNSTSDPVNGPSKTHIYSYLFGPRFYPVGHHLLTPYVHGLFGIATYNLDVPAFGGNPPFSESNNDFSFAVGGGVDLSLGKRFAIRLGQFDYQQTRFLHTDDLNAGLPQSNQNNFKYSGGIVIKFGEK